MLSRRFSPKAALSLPAAAVLALLLPTMVLASLSLVRPDPSDPATFAGTGGVSSDAFGGGSNASGMLQVELPAGSTVDRAYLYAAGIPGSTPATTITFAGESVATVTIVSGGSGVVARADVTSIVAGAVTGAGGTFDFAVTQPVTTEGVALVVTYANASEPFRTIAVLDGAADPLGDSANFAFAEPIDPAADGFEATLSLGITFSYQAGSPHACGAGQASTVDVNGVRLSSCAGNWDDGLAANEALITVGGVGDVADNPVDPNGAGGDDDELYDLVPFLAVGDTGVEITSANASNDDYIFLAIISITAEAVVYGEDDPVPTPTPLPTATPTPTPTPVPTATPVPDSTSSQPPAPVAPSPSAPAPDLAVTTPIVEVGDRLEVEVVNLQPGSSATFELHSAPFALGTLTADADGVIRHAFDTPDVALGAHTVVVHGTNRDGEPVTLQAEVEVVGSDGLPNTATPLPSLTLSPLAAIVLLLGATVVAALAARAWLAFGMRRAV